MLGFEEKIKESSDSYSNEKIKNEQKTQDHWDTFKKPEIHKI